MFEINKFIKQFIENNTKTIVLFVLFILISLPLEAIGFSNYTVKIIDSIKDSNSVKKNYDVICKCIILIGGIYISTRLFYILLNHYGIKIHTELIKDIRNAMFKSYIEKYKEKYKEVEIGDLISKFNTLPHMLEDATDDFLHVILPYCITIVVLVGYFYYVDIRFGIILTIAIFVLGFLLYKTSQISIFNSLKQTNKLYETNEKLQDKMANIYSIIVNNEEDKEIKRMEKLENEYKLVNKKSLTVNLQIETIFNLILFVFIVFMLYMYWQVLKTEKLATKLELYGASFLVLFSLIKYIYDIKWYIVDFINKLIILHNFSESLENTGDIMKGGMKNNFINNGLIIYKNVSFKYNDNTVIHKNLNLTFYPNKLNVIFGKSGSGKTTIIKLLLGFYPTTNGTITIDGTDINDADLTYLRDNISVINQDIKLFNTSIYKNINYGNNITNDEIDKVVTNLDLWSVFDNLQDKLNTQTGVNGTNLSNGQKQIVIILRAFIRNRKILILDEPTSSLDNDTKKIILNTLVKIKTGRTVIVISHDDAFKPIADNFIQLNRIR